MKSGILTLATLFLTSLAVNGICAPASNPSSIKVTVDTYMDPVKFVLDHKNSCQVQFNGSDEAACIFSPDCSRFAGKHCVTTPIRSGKHLMTADFGDFSISKWVFINVADPASNRSTSDAECDVVERMGDARLFLDCDRTGE